MADYTPTGYRCAPTGSAGAAITSSGTSMSAWSELMASMSADGLIYGIWLSLGVSNGGAYIEIGVGAASSEVVVSQMNTSGTISTGANLYWLPVPIPVAAGARVSWRMQLHVSASSTFYAKLLYVPAQPGTVASTAVVPSYFATTPTVTPSGTPWANGAWVQVTAAAPSDLAIYSALLYTTLNAIGSEWEIDIGVGGSGAEVVIATLRWVNMQNFGNQHGVTVPMPLVATVASGNRIAMRARTNQGSTLPINAGLNYYPLPL